MEYEDQTTGEAWKALRERAGMSQSEATAAIGWSDPNRVCALEAADWGTTEPVARRMLGAYGLDWASDGAVVGSGGAVGRLVATGRSVGTSGSTWQLQTVAGVRPLASAVNAMCPDDHEADRLVGLISKRGARRVRAMIQGEPWAVGIV